MKLAWSTKTVAIAGLTVGERGLSLTIAETPDGKLGVIAIEVVRPSDKATVPQMVASILDDHGHKIVGYRKTLPGAKKIAEAYAAKWKARRAKIDRCGCKNIESAGRGSQTRKRHLPGTRKVAERAAL